jgi:serine/threonine protein kinase
MMIDFEQLDEENGYDADPDAPICFCDPNESPLGAGNQGTVSLKTRPDGTLVAVKAFHGPNAVKDYKNESMKMGCLKGCGYVPEILAANDEALEIEMEFLPFGTLQDFLHFLQDFGRQSFFSMRLEKAIQFVRCVAYFHYLGILHCDLTPENILMHPHGVKVCDFALSGVQVGNRFYADPTRKVRPESDIFSIGLVLLEIFGFNPVKTPTIYETRRSSLSALFPPSFSPCSSSPPAKPLLIELRDVVERCLSTEVERRPSAKGLLEELEGMRVRWCM